jgi:hypothetical protein
MDATARPRAITASVRWKLFKWAVRGGVLLLLAGLMIRGCDGLFYYPSQREWYKPADLGLTAEDVYFPTRDGLTLHGWFVRASGAAKGTVIHFHGNAENLTNHIALSAWLPPSGYNLFIFDYRGYGRSQGRVTREGTVIDGHAAVDAVLRRPEVDSRRLFAYGQSLGGAVATVVAAERPEIRALVADSTFSSYRRIASYHAGRTLFSEALGGVAAKLLFSGGHDPIDCVARIAPRPILVIAAENDDICPPHLSRELFEAAGEPKQFWLSKDTGHGAAILDNHEGMRRVLEFFDAAAGERRD